jgi:hypothetical protein
MIADRDIWRAANLLISEHGANAEIFAAHGPTIWRNAATTTGNQSGFRIRRAVVEMQAAPCDDQHQPVR